MPALSEYSNVHKTAFFVLREKGFQIWYDESSNVYCAEKGGWDFMADTPCGLLGVVAIYESIGPDEYREYWWRREGPDEHGNLPRQPTPFRPVWSKK